MAGQTRLRQLGDVGLDNQEEQGELEVEYEEQQRTQSFPTTWR